jgi:hypothetical protein
MKLNQTCRVFLTFLKAIPGLPLLLARDRCEGYERVRQFSHSSPDSVWQDFNSEPHLIHGFAFRGAAYHGRKVEIGE